MKTCNKLLLLPAIILSFAGLCFAESYNVKELSIPLLDYTESVYTFTQDNLFYIDGLEGQCADLNIAYAFKDTGYILVAFIKDGQTITGWKIEGKSQCQFNFYIIYGVINE